MYIYIIFCFTFYDKKSSVEVIKCFLFLIIVKIQQQKLAAFFLGEA